MYTVAALVKAYVDVDVHERSVGKGVCCRGCTRSQPWYRRMLTWMYTIAALVKAYVDVDVHERSLGKGTCCHGCTRSQPWPRRMLPWMYTIAALAKAYVAVSLAFCIHGCEVRAVVNQKQVARVGWPLLAFEQSSATREWTGRELAAARLRAVRHHKGMEGAWAGCCSSPRSQASQGNGRGMGWLLLVSAQSGITREWKGHGHHKGMEGAWAGCCLSPSSHGLVWFLLHPLGQTGLCITREWKGHGLAAAHMWRRKLSITRKWK
jgi:hypothetical protein